MHLHNDVTHFVVLGITVKQHSVQELYLPVPRNCPTVYGIHRYLSLMIRLFVAGSCAKCLDRTSQFPAAIFRLSLCSALTAALTLVLTYR